MRRSRKKRVIDTVQSYVIKVDTLRQKVPVPPPKWKWYGFGLIVAIAAASVGAVAGKILGFFRILK